MKPMVTCILLAYQRPANMPEIIAMLRAQTVPVEIWVINNYGMDDFGADRLIAIPWNAGEWARYVFALRVETEYVFFMDDDFKLADERVLEDAMIIHAAQCPWGILGATGRGLSREAPHYAPDFYDVDGPVRIVKGRFMFFRAEMARTILMPWHPSASDILFSLNAGGPHWVSREIYSRIVELPRFGVGYEFRPEHYAEREAVCAAWLEAQDER